MLGVSYNMNQPYFIPLVDFYKFKICVGEEKICDSIYCQFWQLLLFTNFTGKQHLTESKVIIDSTGGCVFYQILVLTNSL